MITAKARAHEFFIGLLEVRTRRRAHPKRRCASPRGFDITLLRKMKQDPAFFEGKEPVLIFIGKKLRDALRLEDALTESGVDYGVEADEYRAGVIFRTVRAGAFFYVLPETVPAAHEVMLRHGFKPYVE